MTPPSLTVAREILASTAAKARESGDLATPAAIDVVLAELDQRQSIHGAASVITVSSPPAATPPAAILIGSIPGVRQIQSREDAREAFGRQDGDAVWDAFGRAPAPTVVRIGDGGGAPTLTADEQERRAAIREHASAAGLGDTWVRLQIDRGTPIEEARKGAVRSDPAAAITHGTVIHPEATADVMLACPFCRSTTLSVGKPPGGTFPILDRPYVSCTACGARGPLARSDANREAIANWNRRPEPRERGFAAALAGVQRCGTCGAALPLSPGRPGCAECHS